MFVNAGKESMKMWQEEKKKSEKRYGTEPVLTGKLCPASALRCREDSNEKRGWERSEQTYMQVYRGCKK